MLSVQLEIEKKVSVHDDFCGEEMNSFYINR